jgi:phage repressor protein C with HTH and peptisase S24 domain
MCEIAYMQEPGENALYARLMAIKPPDLSLNAWAVRAGVSRVFFHDVRKRGNARHDSLLKVLGAAGVSLAEFEAGEARVKTEVRGTGLSSSEAEAAWAMQQPAKPVPLVGTAFGTELEGLDDIETTELMMSEVLDYVARPPSLANDDQAYAVTVIGDSQAPRFEAGELAFVSPKSPVNVGDDVLVQLRSIDDDDEGSQIAGRISLVLLKRLIKRTGSYIELKQFNPEKTFRVPIERVRRIHRVKGRL